jgi:hypothetical protein
MLIISISGGITGDEGQQGPQDGQWQQQEIFLVQRVSLQVQSIQMRIIIQYGMRREPCSNGIQLLDHASCCNLMLIFEGKGRVGVIGTACYYLLLPSTTT